MKNVSVNDADAHAGTLWDNLRRYRFYILNNALNDFLHKYAGTGIGLMWSVIHPILLVAVFSLVFTVIFPARTQPSDAQSLPFILFLCSGLLPWLSFVDALTRGTSSLVDNAGYLRKLAIPEEVFLARTLVGSGILLGINLMVLVAASLIFGVAPKATWLLVPPVGLLMMLFAFGLSAFLGTLNVFARDVSQIVAIVTQAWLWLTPITYATQAMPSWLQTLQLGNPAYPYIELIRVQYLYGQVGSVTLWIAALAWAGAALLVGARMLGRFRTDIRDAL